MAYTYDAFNRMMSVENGEGIHTYAYRPDGLRQSKTVGGVTTTHIWDGQNIAAEQENGAVTAVYVRGVNLLARQDSTGARQYYLYNAHGDVTQLTDGAGSLVRAYDYDAFGNQRTLAGDPGADGNPFRYCGEYWDNETGTYYLRARYYDPTVGRFLQQDSWDYADPNDPLSLNLYVYCFNNPIRYIDYTGHWGKDIHETDTKQWALDLGFSEDYAKLIAKYDTGTDSGFTNPLPFVGNQSYHFNRADEGKTDTRLVLSEDHFNSAVNKYNAAVEKYNKAMSNLNPGDFSYGIKKWCIEAIYKIRIDKAFKELGMGLHALQDKYAHGNIGVGDWWFASHVGMEGIDDRNYDWENDNLTSVVKSDGRIRYNDTKAATEKYLKKFMETVGLK